MGDELPGGCNYFSTCGARIREIKAIDAQLDNCEHGLRAFQKLPRNMQRRAVSNNPQRLPHSLREKHKREIGNKVKANRRPCRKYRRRPSNLLKEYNRRQRINVWLESHIWHAKRFHMRKKWGYYLPKTPTNKSYRATVRAATETCLIQDISYEACLEIQGQNEQIYDPLSSMMHPDDMKSLLDPEAISGRKWVQGTFYKPNMYPYGMIGDVQLIWSSYTWNEPLNKLWIWVHPAVYNDVLSTLIKLFNYERLENECSIPTYTSEHTKLLDLKDNFVKFRLVGPQSYAILNNVFVPSEVSLKDNSQEELFEGEESRPWWFQFFSDPCRLKANELNFKTWKAMSSNPSSTKKILSLIVRDVRMTLPLKKLPYQASSDQPTSISCEETNAPVIHPIFDLSIRESVTKNMKTTHEINQCRSNALIPGFQLPLSQNETRLPILLMNRPSSNILGHGSGWDVILPSGWAAQTLVAFTMNGGVIGGLKEEETLELEFLTRPLPHHIPDTEAGKLDMMEKQLEKQEEYFKKPPNCRINFTKLGTYCPFGVSWSRLMNSWCETSEDYYVVRDKSYLKWLSSKSCNKIVKLSSREVMKDKKNLPDHKNVTDGLKTQEDIGPTSEMFIAKPPSLDLTNALFYVRIVLLNKGGLEPFTMICLPTEEDLQNMSKKSDSSGVIEPLHEDRNLVKRSELKQEHKKDLKRLSRKRKKARDSVLCSEEDPTKNFSGIKEAMDAAVSASNEENQETIKKVETYDAEMRRLWLPNPEEKPLQICSRKIVGYLTNGGFCLRLGRSGGVGYVVAEVLIQYMKRIGILKEQVGSDDDGDGVKEEKTDFKQIFVLVRIPSSLHYHWARLIVLNI